MKPTNPTIKSSPAALLVQRLKRLLSKLGLHQIPFLQNISRRLDGVINYVDLDGQRIFVGCRDSLGLVFQGVYEPAERAFAKATISPGDVVLDVGANVGYFTMLFSKLAGSDGRVFSFEPDPTNFSLLKRNVSYNAAANVKPVNAAVSDTNGSFLLFQSSENTGDHQMFDDGTGRPSVEVQTIRLDEFIRLEDGPQVTFIKMDVQGYEAKVIRGLGELIDQLPSLTVLTEFWPVSMRKAGDDPRAYVQWYLDRGFVIHELASDGSLGRAVNTADYALGFADGPGDYVNLVCRKG